ncbi:conserved Plasmodium protein, unknown function [Plasmodium ovale]|uniref:RSE1/DDB1/CPSF1 C-terminal domain-containing protein n=1 Tax=Plasmodium ovale TaxID=36330 RepID=A0A1D3U8T0_PLAOA|nr:conserved Plasmodium protein, unknown function [Plasmodium ovale]
MIDLGVEELRRASEVDHCESCNLLREGSIEYILIKNKDLYIYQFNTRMKKSYLIYETKLNGPVIKLVILRNIFINRKRKQLSGILLIYTNFQFIIYKYRKSLNSLVAVLSHKFSEDVKFQSLFYSLPFDVNYTHRFSNRKKDTMRHHSSYILNIPIGKKRKGEKSTKWKAKGKRKRRRRRKVVRIRNGLSGRNTRGNNGKNFLGGKESSKGDVSPGEFMQEGAARVKQFLNKHPSIFKKKLKSRKSTDFCEFHISFSHDFKTVYTFFYTTRGRKKGEPSDGETNAEINTTYFSRDLRLQSVSTVDLQSIYKNFIFIKKLFFHGSNAHVLLQNEPVNIGHTKLEEAGLKLLIMSLEKLKFEVVNLITELPNDLVDVISVKNLLICLCYDYVYILNRSSYNKVIYLFNKSSYMNNTFHQVKYSSLFYDYTHLNTKFKIHTYMIHKKNNIYILNRNYIIEGKMSKDTNDLVNLVRWKKIYTFKSTFGKASTFISKKNLHFVCCYNGICGKSDIDVLVMTGRKKLRASSLRRKKIKRKITHVEEPLQVKKVKKEHEPGKDPPRMNTIVPINRVDTTERRNNIRRNDNFLFYLLTYLNQNTHINEHTKDLNSEKYDLLFKKYKKKIKIIESTFSRINAQGTIELVAPLFVLRGKKTHCKKKKEKGDGRDSNTNNTTYMSVLDRIRVKGVLMDMCKMGEETKPVNMSTYLVLFGRKERSTLQSVFFQIPTLPKLTISLTSNSIRSICATEHAKKSNSAAVLGSQLQYLLINQEKGKSDDGQGEVEKSDSGEEEVLKSENGEDMFLSERKKKQNVLLCIRDVSFLQEKKAQTYCTHYEKSKRRIDLLLREFSERIRRTGGEPFDDNLSDVNYSDDEEYCVGENGGKGEGENGGENGGENEAMSKDGEPYRIPGNRYEKVIYTFKRESEEEDTFQRGEFAWTGSETVDRCQQFFKNFPFVYFSQRDVDIYVNNVYLPHVLLRGKQPNGGVSSNCGVRSNSRNALPNRGVEGVPFSLRREVQSAKHILKGKFLNFFLAEGKEERRTSINLEECSLALLKFKGVLIQVCKNKINYFYSENTYILLKKMDVSDNITSCKLVNSRYIILMHENDKCSVLCINNEVVEKMVSKIKEICSLYNICTLHCLAHGYKGERIDIENFALFLRTNIFQSCSNSIDYASEREHLLSMFKIRNLSTFCAFLKREKIDTENIVTMYEQLSDVRSISVIAEDGHSFILILNKTKNNFTILHLESMEIIFESNFLLNVPKYIYNCVQKNEKKKRENYQKMGKEKTYFLNMYRHEEIINLLFFKLDMDYIITLFITGRPILIYKTFPCTNNGSSKLNTIGNLSRLKFKIIIHKFVQPVLSNVHFEEEGGNKWENAVITSRNGNELNCGYFVFIDEKKDMYCSEQNTKKLKKRKKKSEQCMNKHEKARKKITKSCIIVYPYIDIQKVLVTGLRDDRVQPFREKLAKSYDTNFPPLLLSNYRGKLFIHSLDRGSTNGENYYEPSSSLVSDRTIARGDFCSKRFRIARGVFTNREFPLKGIIKIGKNDFLTFSKKNLHIFSIRHRGYNYVDLCDEDQVELKRGIADAVSGNSSLATKCLYSDENYVKSGNGIFFLKTHNSVNLAFNDDFISKTFLEHPHMFKICTSSCEYILRKRGPKERSTCAGKNEKKSEKKIGEKSEEKIGEKSEEKSEEKIGEKSEEKSEEKIGEKSEEKSEEKIGEKSEEKSEEKIGEKSEEKSEEKIGEKSEEKSEEKIGEKSEEKSEEKIGEKSEEKSEEKIGEKSEEKSEEKGMDQCVDHVENPCAEQGGHRSDAHRGDARKRNVELPSRETVGRLICVIVGIKYDEYYCMKKLLKKRMGLQKDELKTSTLYASEEVQCVPNVSLEDCINNQYTHKMKRFISSNVEDVNTLKDEKEIRRNNKLIMSVKTHAKYYKLLLFHENSKNVYGYYIFEHSEEIQCISFGFLNDREYIYVGTSLNISERIETQGNIYILDFSNVFARYDEGTFAEHVRRGLQTERLHIVGKKNVHPGARLSDRGDVRAEVTSAVISEEVNEGDVDDRSVGGVNVEGREKRGKLTVYMKNTYNSTVTQVHPFYFYSDVSSGGSKNEHTQRSGSEEKRIGGRYTINWGNPRVRSRDSGFHCNVLHSLNSKIFIHEVSDNHFTKGAFIDNNFYISDIKIVRNLIIIADLYKGIYINMYNYEQQYDSRSIICISKNPCPSNLNILCCHYIILNSRMSIIAMDVYNNFLVFSHKNYEDMDTLYIFNYFNFNRRIVKFVSVLHPNEKSNSVLSISNDGTVHFFHPMENNKFLFYKEIYRIVKRHLFPTLALSLHTDLKPDVFVQSIVLNRHKKAGSVLTKNVLFDDLLRQLPFYSCEVLYDLFCRKANLLHHITIGDFLNELHALSGR